MFAIEPCAHIYLLELGRSHSRDNSFAKAGSSQSRIVNDYRDTVAGQTNVQLDSGSAVFQS
jgi:hypothetical protein